MVFDIQRFSVHDGPGIRTTVFLKGCNLRCAWCHNPESLHATTEIQVFPDKCITCGQCVMVCPADAVRRSEEGRIVYDRSRCLRCGRCAEACFAGARVAMGRIMTVDEVLAVVERDSAFYARSGGGATFSGGEPLLQPDFLFALLAECRARGILTAVDTAGDVPFERLRRAADLADLLLFDVKAMDEAVHRKATGTGNARILSNLARIADGSIEIRIRIPVIPSINATEENMAATAAMLRPLKGIRHVQLLPFHKLGEGKYRGLGMEYEARDFEALPKGRIEELAAVFREAGIEVAT
jgi:pyruvate formate lyase activating enzyme